MGADTSIDVSPDATPDAFTFTAVTGAALSTVTVSNAITISGLSAHASTTIDVSGGEYSINGAAYTSASGTVINADSVTVRGTSSDTGGATIVVTLTIGGVSGAFDVTTSVSTYFSATNLYSMPAVKRVVAAYNSTVYTVLRESDNATLNVGFATASDLPDYAALTTFLAGEATPGVGRITQNHDQSGNGHHWTPPATANRPYINLAITNGAGVVPILITGQQGASPRSLGLAITGISVDRQNNSVFHICRPMISLDNVVHWEFRNSSTTPLESMFTSATTGGLCFYNGSATALIAHPRAMLSFIGATSSASGYRVRMRETTYTGSALTSTTMNSMFLGLANVGTTFNGEEEFYGLAVYNSAQSQAQETALEATAISSFSIPTAASFTARVVFAGDSIIHGYLGTFGKNTPNITAPLLTGVPEIFNCGVNGQQMAVSTTGMAAAASVQIDPLFTASYGAGKCILVCDGGTNDIGFTSITANSLKNSTIGYVTNRHNTGFKVIMTDLTPRTDASMDPTKQSTLTAYNATAGAWGADALIQQSADAVMGAAGASDDTSLYGDKLHPITGANSGHGYWRLATAQYAPAINALL